MTPGTFFATAHGPVGALDSNHTPFCTHQNEFASSMRITGRAVFVAYDNPLAPSIALNFGGPSYATVRCVSAIVTVAVCGIELAMTASFACGVPGTETSTFALAWVGGIFVKSPGSARPSTYAHFPSSADDLNHRPEISAKNCPPTTSLYSALSVFNTYSRFVPSTGANSGSPTVWISSAGVVLTWIVGSSVGAPAGFAGLSRSMAPVLASRSEEHTSEL